MQFQNISSVVLKIIIDGREYVLAPNEMRNIVCSQPVSVTFCHDYSSTSMSIQDIALDLSHSSLASNILSGLFHSPYFQIVLDSHFILSCEENEIIQIQRQQLRPCFPCAYDRFFPYAQHLQIIAEAYTFIEKESFIQLFRQATDSQAKKICKIILITFAIALLPLSILCTCVFGLIGLVGSILLLGISSALPAIIWIASAVEQQVDLKSVIPNFESDKIKQYFWKDLQSNKPEVIIG